MAEQHYDEQNQDDYEDVTQRIKEALLKIASDDRIKATITALAKHAGVHRNTITNREWPVESLHAIKAERKIEAERKKNENKNEPKPVDVLTDRLERAHLEILYWFKKHKEVNTLYETTSESVRLLSKSRESLKRQVNELERKIAELETEYERVCDLLNTVTGE